MTKHISQPIRARDLGLPFPGTPGPFNAITDIAGVEVGYTTLIEGSGDLVVGQGPVRTGVTAILPRGKTTALQPVWSGIYTLNGAGEMTCSHWIDDYGYFFGPVCLTNTHSLGITHQATARWMRGHYDNSTLGGYNWALPFVAETFDGFLNDIDGFHITEDHVFNAINTARSGPVAEGNVGGGTGMITYEFKGGTGTASRIVTVGGKQYTVGVLVQSNFGFRPQLNILGQPLGQTHLKETGTLRHEPVEFGDPGTGSIITIIGTDAPMLPGYLQRLARRKAIGIGRTGTPGSDFSGDICMAFSTANSKIPSIDGEVESLDFLPSTSLDPIYNGAVECIEEAIVNAMVAGETMIGRDNNRIDAIDHDILRRAFGDSA
ncbi:P1 family peptidase [Ruegeria sp.]|uniref:DmpA family aminopeptidase n=1 Tax=Ruegeria sp. TaxID=1879320 RepID=UPI0023142F88|nr:P1 family peptidase [Ruegeria sp.]MDA7966846.1 P1 family peptidase [Ruegeria sp.]